MPRSEDLAGLLTELKRRSGRSYDWIGSRVHAGKSTVQRYCTGRSVPPEFGTIERIARVCGADSDEIARLFRLWERAGSHQPADEAHPVATPDGAVARALPVTAPARRTPKKIVLGALLAIAVLAVFALAGDERPQQVASRVPGQWISGPVWQRAPSPVPGTLFGVTINSWSGAMPAFRVGAVRLWDSRTQWANVEPRRDEFDWSILDRLVAGAGAAELPVLFVFGGTPRWANPAGPPTPYPEGSRAAAPTDLAEWDAFVGAVVHRYRGRIEGYELWPLANDHRFFNGSVRTLVEMTRRASQIIRSADPKATVVCPGMGNLWTAEGQRVLRDFAEAGGYGWCDAASIKMFQRVASDPPETMLALAATVDKLLHRSGAHPPLWNTGTMYSIPLEKPLSAAQARNHAVRFFLLGLYARYLNVERMYFYNWGGTKIPVVLQADGGAPTAAALAVEQLQRWLARAHIRSCGQGLRIGMPANVWQCEFTVDDSGRRHDATIRWTDSGTAITTAEPSVKAVHGLDGGRTSVRGGDSIRISEEPILIEYR